jgi:cytochrome c-type biogenesis protein CcmE
MTPKRKRLVLVLGGMAFLGTAATLVLNAFDDSLVFFVSPSDIAEKPPAPSRALRIGGLVENGSVTHGEGGKLDFKVTDGNHDVPVVFIGVPPDLFREGQGVVAEGRLGRDGVFKASTILAKHDERYMPAEVVDALKKSGRWQENPAAVASARPAIPLSDQTQ